MNKVLVKDTDGFERLVFTEVVIPDVVNTHGDLHTRQATREFAYRFMVDGFGINVTHDAPNVAGQKVSVIESFIARDDDPDFIAGSWVVGLHIRDDGLWQSILDNEITGLSYEAYMESVPIELEVDADPVRIGITEPDLFDGHQHTFMVLLDEDGRVMGGGTDEADDGHAHPISGPDRTDDVDDHSHLINFTHLEAVG